MQEKNLGQMVLATAQQYPDLLAIVTDADTLTYSQLRRLVLSFTTKMQEIGIGAASVVVTDNGDITMVAPVILGCAILGAAWVSASTARFLPNHLRPTHILTQKDGVLTDGEYRITPDWAVSEPVDPLTIAPISLTSPFIYAPTSGTTGSPKILVFSQHIQILRALATQNDFVARQTVFCTLFRADAYPFITRFLSAFVGGASVVQSREVSMWYAAGVNCLYGSVAQIGIYFDEKVLPRKLPLVHVSGARLSNELAAHLLNSFDSVIDLYASTETNRTLKNVKFINDAGQITTRGEYLDSTIELVDENDHAVPHGTSGYVRVQNQYLAEGYIANIEASQKSFRNGWFYTGDVGIIGELGELQILGRTGDIINLGGVKVNALEMDDALRAIQGVADAMCFDLSVNGKSNEFLAFVVPETGIALSDIAARFQAQVQVRYGADRAPTKLIETSAVPRAHDGGAQRFLCATIYRNKLNG